MCLCVFDCDLMCAVVWSVCVVCLCFCVCGVFVCLWLVRVYFVCDLLCDVRACVRRFLLFKAFVCFVIDVLCDVVWPVFACCRSMHVWFNCVCLSVMMM